MIEYLSHKKIYATALASVTAIAFATSASAQSSKPHRSNQTTDPATTSLVQSAMEEVDLIRTFATEKPDPSAAAGGSSGPTASQLAKGVTNPVSDVWSLQFQFNNLQLENDRWVNVLYFQPVMPVSLTEDWNLITRPVFTIYDSIPHPDAFGGDDRTTDVGDTILAQVFSPANTEPWIFGIGPTWIFPTAGSDLTGQGKWQVGPAIGGGYITDKFMIAALAQQWWSFAGEDDREDTSQLNILPLIYRYFGDGWSVGYSGNILADWKADDVWTVPLGVGLGKVVKLGQLPVQFQIAGQYFPVRPDGGPEWNIQFQITPIIPKLIEGTLFE